jgi:hypothetical protein
MLVVWYIRAVSTFRVADLPKHIHRKNVLLKFFVVYAPILNPLHTAYYATTQDSAVAFYAGDAFLKI